MSFYLGKDNTNKNILHITKGVATQASLQSGILPTTVFHSDLPYVSYTVYDAIHYTDYEKSGWYSTTSVEFPIEAIQNILNGNKIYMVVVDGSVFTSCDFYKAEIPFGSNIPIGVSVGTWYASDSYAGSEQIYYDDYSHTTVETHRYKKIQGSGKRNVKLIVFDISVDGTYISPAFSNNTVYINNQHILIKGVDLLNYRYISPTTVNNSDMIITDGISSYQLVNSVVGNGLSLNTQNNEVIVSVGGIPVFDTTKNLGNIFFKSATFYSKLYATFPASSPSSIYSEPGPLGGRVYYPASDEVFSDNEAIIVLFTKGINSYYSTSISGAALITFRAGKLFHIGTGNTGPSTVTSWNLAGYGNMLCLTREIVYAAGWPLNTGPIDISITVIRLKR